jgi:hypothetical protein
MPRSPIQSWINIHTPDKEKPFACKRHPTPHLDWQHRRQQNWHHTALTQFLNVWNSDQRLQT